MDTPTFVRHGDRITLEIGIEDWERLLLALGFAAGAAHREGEWAYFWSLIELANRINHGNPAYTPYKIPEHPPSPERPQ